MLFFYFSAVLDSLHMRITFLTLFPDLVRPYFTDSIMARAVEAGLLEVHAIDIRDFSTDRHRKVDDTPYGGGPGMVLQAEPILAALRSVTGGGLMTREQRTKAGVTTRQRIIVMDARGQRLTQQEASAFTALEELIIICGRYEGIDERVMSFVDAQVSIGDFVLTGGELAGLVITDAVARLLPGVLGDEMSAVEESHHEPGVTEYPQYTRPEKLIVDGREYVVPEVLLSGHHGQIERWREGQKVKNSPA
jgi:tRNA (guanine37-N1)-methyltransferase